jgi:hypothetical protein
MEILMTNKQYYDQCMSHFKEMFTEMETDFEFKMGKQISDEVRAQLAEDNQPDQAHNVIKKPCDLLVGSFRDNPADFKMRGMGDTDVGLAEGYTNLMKWILAQNANKYNLPYSFSDAVTCGLGWSRIELDYTNDILNGDILIRSVPPFNVLFDPNTRSPDLSDCQYIIVYSFLSKEELTGLYPDSEAKIAALEEKSPMGRDVQGNGYDIKGINVIERWYKIKTKIPMAVRADPDNPGAIITVEITKDSSFDEYKAQYPDAQLVKFPSTKIRVRTETDEGLLLMDEDHPDGMDMFPFVPWWGWYEPSFNDWAWKVQGIPRIMRGPQEELNKVRQKMLLTTMSMPFGGFFYKKGTINPNEMNQVSAGMRMIPFEGDAADIRPFNGAVISEALVQYASILRDDIQQIGPNPDLLGQQMSKSEPGINIQLRQKQGVATLKDFFEHGNLAYEQIGKYLVKLVNAKWGRSKIERIIETPLPENWEATKAQAFFDVTVNLMQDSPSYRFAVQSQLMEMLRNVAPMLPPQTVLEYVKIITKFSDLPEAERQQLIASLQPPPPPPMPPQSGGAPGETILDENGQPIQQAPPAEGVPDINTQGEQL